MQNTRKHNGIIALLLILCMLAAGCTTQPAASTAPAPAAGGTEAQSTAPDAQQSSGASTDAAAPLTTSSRDTINLAINQVIETLNPWASGALIDNQMFYQLYECLFFYNDAGEFEPRVAKSFEVSEDGKTYTVTLNDGVKFHNGKEVTAEDVAWSLNYEFIEGAYTNRRAAVSQFESATATGEKTLEVKASESDAAFFASLCQWGFILCKDEVLAAEANGTIGTEWVPFGTGPYVITSYNPDSMIVLEAFPDYYRGAARIKTVNYQVLSDNNTTTIAFEAGDLDFITVPTASWANISANPNYNTYLAPTNHISWFMINVHNNDALSNKLVRQALSYGMDREAMVVVAYDGIAQPAYSYFNPDTVFGGFTPEELEAAGIPSYEYNPEKAKALLAEAGYPNGVDIGTILCINGSYWEKMSTVFQDNMKEIGVTVAIELADSSACRAKRRELDYNLATTGSNIVPDASYGYMNLRYVSAEEAAAGNVTEMRLQDENLDALYRKAMTTQDPVERRAAYLEVNRVAQDEMYALPTFYKATPYAYQADLVCDEINTNYYYVYNFCWK